MDRQRKMDSGHGGAKTALLLGAAFIACAANPRASAQCDLWQSLGATAPIYALTVYDGNLIIAGFSGTITSWNGSSGQALGSGMNNTIRAFTVYGDQLVAGGQFTIADGASANYIALWNGETWQPLGNGMNESVRSLSVYDGELIAGGLFTTAGGQGANYIARWDGTSWQALGTGMNGPVHAQTLYNGELIAGGEFQNAGGQFAFKVARWNGSSWQPFGSGMNGTGVFALTVYDGQLIAGGLFTTAGGQSANSIARWNGSSWEPMGAGMNSTVVALTVYDGELIAGGAFATAGGQTASRIARWNGSSWQALGFGTNHTVMALASYGGQAIVGGLFTSAPSPYLARWSHSLSILQHPSNTVVGAGQTALMSVTMLNPGQTFQWRKEGAPLSDGGHISGANTNTLTIASATNADFGVYDVKITNACGSVLSDPAALGIVPAPETCPADIAPERGGDDVVNVSDLLAVIRAWGACP